MSASGVTDSRWLLRLARPVSRTFYLSMVGLPGSVRGSITLAYLLARVSDTLADASSPGADQRLAALDCLVKNPEQFSLEKEGVPTCLSSGEEVLIGHWPQLWESYQVSTDRDLIGAVWETILEGQRWDLERERTEKASQPLPWEDLLHYTWLVAGCVGEFWTRLLLRKIPDCSAAEIDTLLPMAREYGKALQLLNICRDAEKDRERGRVYLDERDRGRAIRKIRAGLAAGEAYAERLRPWRLRFASKLPAAIGGLMLGPGEGLIRPGRDRVRRELVRCAVWAAGNRRGRGFPD